MNFGVSYAYVQYDIFQNVGFSIRKKSLAINQEFGLGYKYLILGKFNWRCENQLSYYHPISKKFSLESGISIGLTTQFRNSKFYQLEEKIFFGFHRYGFVNLFLRNQFGIMQQMKAANNLFSSINFVSQIGVIHEF